MKNKQFRRAAYYVCMAAIVVIVLAMVVPQLLPEAERYVSVHPASTLAPLWGLSPESLINTGDAKELDTLPGVGEVISQRIIETREALGGFRLPEDLMLVKGIGEKTFAKIMDALDEPLVQLPEMSK